MLAQAAAAALVCSTAAATTIPQTRTLRVAVQIRTEGVAGDPKAFRAEIDGQDTPIQRVLAPGDPQMILVVLDLVGDLARIDSAKEALARAIATLPENTYVGLLRAQDGVSVLLDPTGSREPAIRVVRELPVSGRPGLLDTLDSVESIADGIARKAQVRLSVLYVTDSDVSEYREDYTNPVINSSDPHDLSRKFPESLVQEKISKIQESLAGAGTPLHIVHLAYRGDRLNEAYQNGLTRLAGALAGSAVFCRSLAEIPEAIGTALDNITSEYTLILAVPPRASGSTQIRITAGDLSLGYRTRMNLKKDEK